MQLFFWCEGFVGDAQPKIEFSFLDIEEDDNPLRKELSIEIIVHEHDEDKHKRLQTFLDEDQAKLLADSIYMFFKNNVRKCKTEDLLDNTHL
jgi:hypothetical protein